MPVIEKSRLRRAIALMSGASDSTVSGDSSCVKSQTGPFAMETGGDPSTIGAPTAVEIPSSEGAVVVDDFCLGRLDVDSSLRARAFDAQRQVAGAALHDHAAVPRSDETRLQDGVSRADGGVACEGQFAGGVEDAQQIIRLVRWTQTNNPEAGPGGDPLHLLVGQAVDAEDDGNGMPKSGRAVKASTC
jgi:hypothetical protein